MRVRNFPAILVTLLAACAPLPGAETLTPPQRAAAERIEILHGQTNRPFVTLGTVKGTGCRQNAFDTTIPESDALLGLKLQAALLSADAVIHTDCRSVTIDWFTDCFNLIECTGVAVRFRDE